MSGNKGIYWTEWKICEGAEGDLRKRKRGSERGIDYIAFS